MWTVLQLYLLILSVMYQSHRKGVDLLTCTQKDCGMYFCRMRVFVRRRNKCFALRRHSTFGHVSLVHNSSAKHQWWSLEGLSIHSKTNCQIPINSYHIIEVTFANPCKCAGCVVVLHWLSPSCLGANERELLPEWFYHKAKHREPTLMFTPVDNLRVAKKKTTN